MLTRCHSIQNNAVLRAGFTGKKKDLPHLFEMVGFDSVEKYQFGSHWGPRNVLDFVMKSE